MHVQFLTNSSAIEDSIYNSPRLQRLLKDKKSDADVVEEFFLLALARLPKEAEKKKLLEYLTAEKNGRDRAIPNDDPLDALKRQRVLFESLGEDQ